MAETNGTVPASTAIVSPAVATRTIHYRPFLFTKKAEFWALEALEPASRDGLTPVYVVHPRELDYDNGKVPKISLDAHVAKVAKGIVKVTDVQNAYIDVKYIEGEGALGSGVAPITHLHRECAAQGVDLAPLVRPSSATATVDAVVAELMGGTLSTVAVCLSIDEWPSIDPAPLRDLLDRLSPGAPDIDLMIDVGDRFDALTCSGVCDAITAASAHGLFRSVTVVGAAFPKTAPTGVGNHEVERSEYNAFCEIETLCGTRGLPVPDYGDWTISHPDPMSDVDPKFMNISAQFRYCIETGWIVAKGNLFKGNGGKGVGGAAVPPMLRSLGSHAQFGATSRGRTEAWIDLASTGTNSGNPTTWRQWGVLRHLELTMHQLATRI
ncbi:hypothetical protein SEA_DUMPSTERDUDE_33 [Gordonia phage DumpsterDude]|uniref:Uncharacterized protein n=1 Tax=Gordonia phage DumpsterDude TaxID=2713262 RepID=A0A6G8R0C0_9CAUD|nr:hypothetical protein JZX77_gp33 [Gordonia phage DumpsterDude]QIN93621.1 hypothetical protein SEA_DUMPSTERDUDE_33 [Gordonia phage DumpsterDude]